MLPILLRLGPITIYSFGVAIFFALLLAAFIVWKQARLRGLSEEAVFDTFLLTLFFGLISARLGYVYTHWSIFSADYSRIILYTHYPGLSYLFGLVGGLLTAFLGARSLGLNSFLVLDFFATAFSWSLIIGAFGAYLDGSIKNPILILLASIYSVLLLVSNRLVRKKPYLAPFARRHGLFISAYLIFLLASLLIMPEFARQEERVLYLALLFIFIILFMVKFPASVLSQIKKYLEEKRADAESRLKELKKDDPFEDKARLLDRASEDSEVQSRADHERIAAMRQQMSLMLVQTRKALTKIKIGKYGICESCGKMIDTDRLAAMPTATLCLNCEKKREK